MDVPEDKIICFRNLLTFTDSKTFLQFFTDFFCLIVIVFFYKNNPIGLKIRENSGFKVSESVVTNGDEYHFKIHMFWEGHTISKSIT